MMKTKAICSLGGVFINNLMLKKHLLGCVRLAFVRSEVLNTELLTKNI